MYDELFSRHREESCSLLEIGVQNGGSLEIWAKYFKNAACIVGCDIDPRCAVLEFRDPRIRIVIGDASTAKTIGDILAISERFNVIIDDGSHKPRDVISSFIQLFPRLSVGGLYIAEDLHCDYFASHGGGIRRTDTATQFFFRLVQLMGAAYWVEDASPHSVAGGFIPDEQLMWFVENQWIESIAFYDSLVIVKRALVPGGGSLGDRVIVGDRADVNREVVELRESRTRRT
ncbi:MAG: class I SAM-dependent methyltransferase [Casimicrobiaceae bacterium]